MILRKAQFAPVALAMAALTVSCGIIDPVLCTANVAAAVTVDVRDSVTNALAGRGSRVVARDGTFADTTSQTSFSDGPFGLASERAGTYAVTVEQTGYRTWSQAGIVVTKGSCHVSGVSLVARLQR